MPEGDETTTETTAPEPAAPEATEPAQEAAPETTEQAAGPDLSDALGQLNARLDRAGVPPAQDEEPLAPLLGQADDDYYDDYEQDQPEQPQGQLTEEQQQQQAVQQALDEAVRQRVEPIFYKQEMDRRTEGIQSFANQNPDIKKPEVMQAVEAQLSYLDPNFGQPDYAPDPRVVRTAYLAAQAELAGQTSPAAGAAGQEGAAEAAGQGATLETGAGPGAPPQEMDPQEEAYLKALTPGTKVNQFGF